MALRSPAQRRAMFARLKAGRVPTVDRVVVREIALWAANDGSLYRQMISPTIDNYARKMKRGVFSKEDAIQGIANHIIPEALRRYNKENMSHVQMNWRERQLAAMEMFPSIEEQARYAVKEGKT